MNHAGRPRFAALAVVTVIGLVGTACTSGSSAKLGGKPLALRSVVAGVKAMGRIDVTGQTVNRANKGRIVGSYDYRAALANLTIPILTPKGRPRASYLERGNAAWIELAHYAGPKPKDTYASALLTPPGSKRWLTTGPNLSYVVALFGAYDPAKLVDFLDLAKVAMLPDGSDTIGGASTDHYRAELTKTKPTVFHLRTVELWVNAKHEIVRVKLLTAAKNVVEYDVLHRSAAVEVIEPPAGEIANPGTASKGPQLSGPYVPVTSGTAAGINFSVLRAPAGGGLDCWRVESSPSFVGISKDRDDGARCLAPPTGDAPEDRVSFPVDSGTGNPYELLGALLPAGSSAVLTMTDGSTRAFVADPAGFALYAGPSDPGAGFLSITLPGGQKLSCGPGAVTSVADLGGVSAGELASQAWACVPPETAP